MWIAHSRVCVQSGHEYSQVSITAYIKWVQSASTRARCQSQSVYIYISGVGRISHARVQYTIRCLL